MATEESGCLSLEEDVIEMVLAFLPISDIPKAALVCKQWHSIIASSPILWALSHSLHECKPWLFLLGSNKRRGLGFDPVARRWIPLPPLTFNPNGGEAVLVTESNGFLFCVAGGRLKFTDSFLNPGGKWHETESCMQVWRQNPVVCKDYDGGKIFVIGGVHELEENDPLCVEMFDLESGEWELCDPLPHEFNKSASSTWLSSAVSNGKIFVVERYTGDLCCYELQSKRWGKVMRVKAAWPLRSSSECVKYYCVSSGLGLVLAGLMKEKKGVMSFRMCIVEEECKVGAEICMPAEMLSLINGRETEEEENSSSSSSWEWGENIECKGEGDLVYVFNKSRYVSKSRRVCLFDFSTGVWEMLSADHPSLSVNWADSVVFVCSPVTLDQTNFSFKA